MTYDPGSSQHTYYYGDLAPVPYDQRSATLTLGPDGSLSGVLPMSWWHTVPTNLLKDERPPDSTFTPDAMVIFTMGTPSGPNPAGNFPIPGAGPNIVSAQGGYDTFGGWYSYAAGGSLQLTGSGITPITVNLGAAMLVVIHPPGQPAGYPLRVDLTNYQLRCEVGTANGVNFSSFVIEFDVRAGVPIWGTASLTING